MSKNELKRRSGEGSGNGILFKDIDVLTKALYEDKTQPRSIINSTASSRSKAIVKPHLPETKSKSKINNEDRFLKDKKSIWSWNTFKSFTHVRNKRFNCCFSLQVHSIEGLPPSFDNLTLCVKWKRRDGELTTYPAPVSQGVAEFEELLTNTCSVYGSRSGPHHSAKYEAKHFLLYASVYGDPELDLGKHRVDLTRLLPLTLEELEEEKSSGKWSTTYRLSGKAKGASMNVSFGYSVVDNSKSPGQSQMKRGDSLPVMSRSYNRSVEDIKDLHEVLPVSKSELSESVGMLYKKLEEEKSITSVDYETKREHPNQDFDSPDPDKSEFSVLEQGIEFSVKEKATPEHDIKAYEEEEGSLKDQRFDEKELIMQELELALNNVNEVSDSQEESEYLKEDEEGTLKDQNFDEKELIMQELELALNNVNEESDSQEESENPKEDEEVLKGTETESVAGFEYEESENVEVKISYKEKGKALKLDHATEVVAEDFLNMLGIEHSPFSLTSESESNSPRERLLRQFEKDALTNGSSLFNFNLDDDDFICDSSSTSMLPEEHNKTKASIMEDMESEALMREWGLNEKVFERAPSSTSTSQVDFSPEEPLELPPLGDNLGPFVQTSNGGFLRSMSPEIFKNGKNGGNLIMQVSSPVVVPAEMGSGVMDVLQGLASVGIEKLSFQANKLMPLEDISGKTIQQIALEQESSSIVGKSQSQRSRKYDLGEADPEYVSLEDLAPLAMNKIEALSMEGLRIQSGMSEKEAPSNVSPKSIGEMSVLEGKMVNLGTGGLQLLDVKNNGDDGDDGMDGMMGLSVSLDEWMRLDSGEIDESERTSRILTAHHASDVARVKRGGKNKKGGLLGNNFTVALMVQLRDPLRNFEPVGTPMLALVQVERVFVPPKPKIHSSIYWRKPQEDEVKVEEVEEESVLVPEFKVVEVHVAGVKSESESEGGKKGIWGGSKLNVKQEKAGSRWLVANGMGKKNGKHPLMKSKAADKSSPSSGGGSLWSISSKGKGKVDPAVTVRNPNVIIPNETVRLLSGAGFL